MIGINMIGMDFARSERKRRMGTVFFKSKIDFDSKLMRLAMNVNLCY